MTWVEIWDVEGVMCSAPSDSVISLYICSVHCTIKDLSWMKYNYSIIVPQSPPNIEMVLIVFRIWLTISKYHWKTSYFNGFPRDAICSIKISIRGNYFTSPKHHRAVWSCLPLHFQTWTNFSGPERGWGQQRHFHKFFYDYHFHDMILTTVVFSSRSTQYLQNICCFL